MRPLQVGLVLSMVAAGLTGILSNPIFTIANRAVTQTPLMQNTVAQVESTQSMANQSQSPEDMASSSR